MNKITKRTVKVTIEVPEITIGLDVGDRKSVVKVLNAQGDVVHQESVKTTEAALCRFFTPFAGARVALEAGAHSPWISRLLQALKLEVVVSNPRKVRLISANHRKSDSMDAELEARLGRVDPDLLYPIQHRSVQAQSDLAVIHARDALVKCRTLLINHVRGVMKSLGHRLPGCSAHGFVRKAAGKIPESLAPALEPIVQQIAALTGRIDAYDRQVAQLCTERYPETARLTQVGGIGPLTALAFRLTLDDPHRFRRSRSVGAYLGLVSRQRDSADQHPQLRITKAGDPLLRRLLVSSAQYILGPFGKDCALRRYGRSIVAKGGKYPKNRAVVAVARKLAVLLHRLWVGGQTYDPLRNVTPVAA